MPHRIPTATPTLTHTRCLFATGWGEGELSVAEVFKRLDTDGSGTLDLSEVERLVAALGVVLSRTSAQDMFAQMDVDGDGVVDVAEFEGWWAAHYSDEGGFITSDGEDDTE